MALHGFGPWPSIVTQVLDGPPGDATRRLSTFLLIPVGFNRQGFAYGAANFQKTRSWLAQGARYHALLRYGRLASFSLPAVDSRQGAEGLSLDHDRRKVIIDHD
jgi:hypothetical protein